VHLIGLAATAAATVTWVAYSKVQGFSRFMMTARNLRGGYEVRSRSQSGAFALDRVDGRKVRRRKVKKSQTVVPCKKKSQTVVPTRKKSDSRALQHEKSKEKSDSRALRE
jgi:hypothetical protein